jgi:cytochrome b involved in lipid metabolism
MAAKMSDNLKGESATSISKKIFTYADLREHRTSTSAWMAVHGKVYDVTSFISRHPGMFSLFA